MLDTFEFDYEVRRLAAAQQIAADEEARRYHKLAKELGIIMDAEKVWRANVTDYLSSDALNLARERLIRGEFD